MQIMDIPIEDIDISEFNTRKDLADGQYDSSIDDLASSVAKQGLLSPITVFRRPDGLYSLVAGQRRLLACKRLGWSAIPAIIREAMSPADATAVSLVENVHRADMNPRDKAIAFKSLLDHLGSVQAVTRETGVGASTVKKYIRLLDLAPQLQDRLAAGEVKNTEALARLAQQVRDPQKQIETWDKISSFTQEVQQQIISRLEPGLSNLPTLVGEAIEGQFDVHMVRNCPFDCPTIPGPLKQQVADMIRKHDEE
jgi:ParB family chromosome partitioning protein